MTTTAKESDPLVAHGDNAATTPDRCFNVWYWIIIVVQVLTVVTLLPGQTLGIFRYDWTVSIGLAEPEEEIGSALKQTNRTFGVADTLLYIPLLLSSAVGLILRRRKSSIICTAASAGISSYWSLFSIFQCLFETYNDVEEWTYVVPAFTYIFCGFWFCYGVVVLTFLYVYMDTILQDFD